LQAENRAREEALAVFKEQLLGRRQAEALQAQLDAAITKEAKAKRTANLAESNVVCQAHEMACAKLLAGMTDGLQIPSMRQFEGRYKTCLATFEVGMFMLVGAAVGCGVWLAKAGKCVRGGEERGGYM
jgi:hypothetical protein